MGLSLWKAKQDCGLTLITLRPPHFSIEPVCGSVPFFFTARRPVCAAQRRPQQQGLRIQGAPHSRGGHALLPVRWVKSSGQGIAALLAGHNGSVAHHVRCLPSRCLPGSSPEV